MTGHDDALRERLTEAERESVRKEITWRDGVFLGDRVIRAIERILTARLADVRAEAAREALRAAANDWPIGVCAHRCFRTDEHVAPKDCLHGPTWLSDRADRIGGEQR